MIFAHNIPVFTCFTHSRNSIWQLISICLRILTNFIFKHQQCSFSRLRLKWYKLYLERRFQFIVQYSLSRHELEISGTFIYLLWDIDQRCHILYFLLLKSFLPFAVLIFYLSTVPSQCLAPNISSACPLSVKVLFLATFFS